MSNILWSNFKENTTDFQPKNSFPRAMKACIILHKYVILKFSETFVDKQQ